MNQWLKVTTHTCQYQTLTCVGHQTHFNVKCRCYILIDRCYVYGKICGPIWNMIVVIYIPWPFPTLLNWDTYSDIFLIDSTCARKIHIRTRKNWKILIHLVTFGSKDFSCHPSIIWKHLQLNQCFKPWSHCIAILILVIGIAKNCS